MSLHTLHLHKSTLVRMLNAAVKEGVMDKNSFYALGRHERIAKQQAERDYLTKEELLALIETPTTNATTKRAFLFCCFTGLRYSDVSALTWRNNKTGQWWIVRFHSIHAKDRETGNYTFEPVCIEMVAG